MAVSPASSSAYPGVSSAPSSSCFVCLVNVTERDRLAPQLSLEVANTGIATARRIKALAATTVAATTGALAFRAKLRACPTRRHPGTVVGAASADALMVTAGLPVTQHLASPALLGNSTHSAEIKSLLRCVNGGYSTPGMCTACASCPAGQYRINCAGLSAGTCAACPQSTTCPAAGQFLSGCSGTSLGTCQTCNNLQATSSAAGWSYSPPGAANRTVLPIRTPATLALSNNPCAAGACGGAVLRPVAALGSAWVQPPALLNELRCFCVPHDFPTIDPLRVVVAARAPRRREPDHPVCEQLPCMDYLRLQYASHHACCSSCNRNVRQLLLQREHVFK